MKKLLLLTIFFSVALNAQHKSYEDAIVTYNIGIKKEQLLEELDGNKAEHRTLKNLIEKAQPMKATLHFTNMESIYQLKEELAMDDSQINLIKIFAGSDHLFYFNADTREFLQQTATLGKTFLVQHQVPQWTITKEKKKIGDYVCYKAILKREDDAPSNGKQVSAWFAPGLPFQFGPHRYYGLPGLILQVEDKPLLFTVESIVFQDEKVQVNKPDKGEKVSVEQYKEISRKLVPDFFGN